MGYLPYLPQDAASAGDEHTEGTVEVINADLAELLRLPASQFWQVVQKDKSLQTCLDSYLQFARRAHDDSTPGSAPPSDAQQQLAKRVFLVFLRMVTTSEQQAGGLAQQAQAELLYQRWLLDVPKLLDLAVLYGRDNPDLVRRLLNQAFSLQPGYASDVAEVVPTLVNNLADVRETCQNAARTVQQADEAPLGVATGLADGLAYLRDACTTLLAFAEAYPPAARMLLHGGAGLLGVLAALHEELLPLLRSAATRLADVSATRPAAAQMPAQLHQLQIGLQSLAHVLLLHAYLQPAAPMPPEQGKARRPDGRISGDALMAAVMAAQHAGTAGATGGLLRAANERFGTADAFSAALSQGTVVLDPVQRDYCLVALGAATDSAAAQRTAGETSTSQAGVADEALAAKLRQIKELLPDYGDGFLAACLDVYNKDPEQVINHLLEGSLHHDLASLDTMMPLKARQSAAQQAAGKGKGKAPAAENGAAEVSWLNTPAQANGRTAGAPSTSGAGAAATAAAGRKAHKGTSRFLQRTEQDKAAIRMHADAAQWEYEDEYDDSYDDLLANGADGVADVEGDDEYGPSRRGRGFHEDSSPGPRGAFGSAPSTAPASASGTGPGPRLQPGSGSQPCASGFGSAGGPATRSGRGFDPGAANSTGRGQTQGQKSQGGRSAKAGKLWVLDGRIYNYKKEGAAEVQGQSEADRLLEAAQAAAQAIHGLGPGGNVPLVPQNPQKQPQQDGQRNQGQASVQSQGPQPGGQRQADGQTQRQDGPGDDGDGGRGGGGRGGRGGGGRGPPGSGPPGRGRGSHAHKDKHKAAIGNHHRKDRALKKMGGPAG